MKIKYLKENLFKPINKEVSSNDDTMKRVAATAKIIKQREAIESLSENDIRDLGIFVGSVIRDIGMIRDHGTNSTKMIEMIDKYDFKNAALLTRYKYLGSSLYYPSDAEMRHLFHIFEMNQIVHKNLQYGNLMINVVYKLPVEFGNTARISYRYDSNSCIIYAFLLYCCTYKRFTKNKEEFNLNLSKVYSYQRSPSAFRKSITKSGVFNFLEELREYNEKDDSDELIYSTKEVKDSFLSLYNYTIENNIDLERCLNLWEEKRYIDFISEFLFTESYKNDLANELKLLSKQLTEYKHIPIVLSLSINDEYNKHTGEINIE